VAQKGKMPGRWADEKKTIKAVQVAFDVGEEVQLLIRREALERGINPPDRVRQILGLPTTTKPQRPRLSISLSDADFRILAEKFNTGEEDRLSIRQIAAEKLIAHLENRKSES
tara:strand:+ start:32 stop:370 length:339 start_codon:yes stop_codon:yes gene_type:complete